MYKTEANQVIHISFCKTLHNQIVFPHRKEEGGQTEPEHRLVDFAGRLLAQKSRMVTLDGKQRHNALKK